MNKLKITQEAPMPNLVISNTSIRQDSDNRYCLNDLHEAAGGNKKHRPSYFLANQQTKELIKEISIAGIPAIYTKQRLGTFVVRELVYAYAMWISAAFNLKVIRAYDKQVSQPKPTLDDFIPGDDNEIACSLESLLYRSYKEPLGVRALIWIDDGQATLVKQLKHSEVAIDSLDTQPLMTAIKQLTEEASRLTEKYNIDLYQLPGHKPKEEKKQTGKNK
jgi:hypothetical protein